MNATQGYIGYLIRRLHQQSSAIFTEEMATAGIDLTPMQFAALAEIRAAKDAPMDQARLADLVGCDRATLGGIVERLEKKQLISRIASPKDRRARLLVMEKPGHDLLAQVEPLVRELQTRIVGTLDRQEQESLIHLLSKALSETGK